MKEKKMAKARVLIVEDEAIIAADLKDGLTKMEYEVCGPAKSGEQAVSMALRQKPDVILMDIALAGTVDGISAARKIREKKDIPIIFLTAFSDDAILEKAKRATPSGYLIKPFQTRELQSTIEVVLHKADIERGLRDDNRQLTAALADARTLSNIYPICASCKRIRDKDGAWMQVESYFRKHAGAEFSHGICPECRPKLYPELEDNGKRREQRR